MSKTIQKRESISRRNFVKGVAIAGGGIVAASCAPGATPAPGAAPRVGGNLNVSIPALMEIFDPATHNKQEEALVLNNVYETLTQVNTDHELVPMIAESWEPSSDLTAWTFKLREGVTFHNGRSMTADDVVFTINRILDPETASSGRDTLAMVVEVTAVDNSTVRLDLDYAYADIPAILADAKFAVVPNDEDIAANLVSQPVGTGPFKFDSYTPGSDFVMVRNADYHGPAAVLDSVTLKFIPEIAARVVSLKNAETDVLWQIDYAVFDELKDASGIRVRDISTESWDPLVMDVRTPPFDNPLVRQAVRYAIDKDELIKLALFGHGVKVPFPLSPQNPLFPADLPNIPRDIPKAMQLLSDAGYPDGFETPLYLGVGRPIRVAEGIAIAEMLKDVNIRCDVQQLPLDVFFNDIEFKAEFYTTGWRGEPAADSQIYPRFHSEGSWNVAHWSNSEVDQLLEQSRRTASIEERRDLFKRVGEIANEDGPYMIAWVANRADAWRSEVIGFEPHPLNFMYLRDVAVRVRV